MGDFEYHVNIVWFIEGIVRMKWLVSIGVHQLPNDSVYEYM